MYTTADDRREAELQKAEEDREMADIDTFCDWLYAECSTSNAVYSDWIVSFPARIPEKIKQANVAELLHLLLTGTADEMLVARDEILKRKRNSK